MEENFFFRSSRFTIRDSAARRRGFTLVELVVSIAIFITVTSVVMVSQHRFGGNIMITNLAYDVALGIRQAQVYGISVKKVAGVSQIQQFNSGYGVHFSSPNHFILFADADGSGSYNPSDDNGNSCTGVECVSFFKVERGNFIARVCGQNNAGGSDCFGDNTNNNIDALDIIFTRPEPEPAIKGFKGGAFVNNSYSSAVISVVSPQGVSKSVSVSSSGQISVVDVK